MRVRTVRRLCTRHPLLRSASPTPHRRRTFQSCERQERRSLSVEKFDILRRALAAAMYGYICEPIGLDPSTRTHREPPRNDSGFMSPWKSTYTPHHERDQGSLPDGKSQRPAPIHPPARPLAFKFINHTYTSQSGFGPPRSVRTSAKSPLWSVLRVLLQVDCDAPTHPENIQGFLWPILAQPANGACALLTPRVPGPRPVSEMPSPPALLFC